MGMVVLIVTHYHFVAVACQAVQEELEVEVVVEVREEDGESGM